MLKKSNIIYFLLILFVASAAFYFFSEMEKMRAYNGENRVSYTGKVQVQQPKSKNVNLEYLHCMATNIYHEARGEPYIGQVAVARVVMNRVQHGFAENPCRVVYQKTTVPDSENPLESKTICQFSWVCEDDIKTNKASPAYKQALQIANDVLSKNAYNDVIPSSILYFHNTSVNPGWNYKESMTIGNHVFYSRNRIHRTGTKVTIQ